MPGEEEDEEGEGEKEVRRKKFRERKDELSGVLCGVEGEKGQQNSVQGRNEERIGLVGMVN